MRGVGEYRAEGFFHGSPEKFDKFKRSRLRSFGFHFGDIEQAKHFAGSTGWIYKADLLFENLIDIGERDLGWKRASLIAFAFHSFCLQNGIRPREEDFFQILGPPPWSSTTLRPTTEISSSEQGELVRLFKAYGFDGVRYVNQFELPAARRTAYFVIDRKQIENLRVTKA